MSDFTEAPFSANFVLYGPEALRVQFTVRSNTDPTSHVALVGEYLAAAQAAGYATALPGLEAGERVEEVDAWVLGETSRDEPCVYLYSSHHGLKYRVATVYVEDLGVLPFKIDLQQKRWMGAAPERETAEKKGVLNVVDPFKIVLEPTGKTTDAGNEITRFARVHDAAPAQPATQQPPAGGETSWRAQQEREHLRPKQNGNGADTKPFHRAVARKIKYFKHAEHVKATMDLLGLAYPETKEDAETAMAILKQYATLRADGTEQEQVVKLLQGELALDETDAA